jgi:sphingosine kinase
LNEITSLILTERAGHATEIMENLNLSAWYGVVIVSGDGLIYEVIKSFGNHTYND